MLAPGCPSRRPGRTAVSCSRAGERLGAALRGLARPARLITAPAGMFGQPPGMLPPELCAYWTAQAPMLTVETVPGANHYTILLDPGHAATVARRLAEA